MTYDHDEEPDPEYCCGCGLDLADAGVTTVTHPCGRHRAPYDGYLDIVNRLHVTVIHVETGYYETSRCQECGECIGDHTFTDHGPDEYEYRPATDAEVDAELARREQRRLDDERAEWEAHGGPSGDGGRVYHAEDGSLIF